MATEEEDDGRPEESARKMGESNQERDGKETSTATGQHSRPIYIVADWQLVVSSGLKLLGKRQENKKKAEFDSRNKKKERGGGEE